MKRARQGDRERERERQERARRRRSSCLLVLEKSGREANISTTEWAAVWFDFTLFISSSSSVTASSVVLFQVCCNLTPAKQSHLCMNNTETERLCLPTIIMNFLNSLSVKEQSIIKSNNLTLLFLSPCLPLLSFMKLHSNSPTTGALRSVLSV